jgi:hypothetical protein
MLRASLDILKWIMDVRHFEFGRRWGHELHEAYGASPRDRILPKI